eukprot:364356-Chlamydomonas_euryale.AAC.4
MAFGRLCRDTFGIHIGRAYATKLSTLPWASTPNTTPSELKPRCMDTVCWAYCCCHGLRIWKEAQKKLQQI